MTNWVLNLSGQLEEVSATNRQDWWWPMFHINTSADSMKQKKHQSTSLRRLQSFVNLWWCYQIKTHIFLSATRKSVFCGRSEECSQDEWKADESSRDFSCCERWLSHIISRDAPSCNTGILFHQLWYMMKLRCLNDKLSFIVVVVDERFADWDYFRDDGALATLEHHPFINSSKNGEKDFTSSFHIRVALK